MTTTKKFKAVQLFRLNNGSTGASFEIAPDEKCDCNIINMSEESKESLWQFFKDDWETPKFATVQFEGFLSDGITPKNPVITHVSYN